MQVKFRHYRLQEVHLQHVAFKSAETGNQTVSDFMVTERKTPLLLYDQDV